MRREDLESTGLIDHDDHLRAVVKVSLAASAGATSFSVAGHLLGWGGAWAGLGISCAATVAIGAFALAYLAAEPSGEAAEIDGLAPAAKPQAGRTSQWH